MRNTDLQNLLGTEPEVIVRPESVEEIAEMVAAASRDSKSIIPWGSGTGQAYGYLPRSADILLDLFRLNRIVAHEPGDLTVTVEGAATLNAVQAVLARHNQFLPLDPPDSDCATIGGIIATDAFGPSRAHYGTVRDWLIGITVIDAQGRLVRGGGKVVKNVTGYDLPKLHIGALGTLGIIVEATFKVAPRPDTSRPLMFRLPTTANDEQNAAIARQISLICLETAPTLSLLRDQGDARIAAFIFSGTADVVDSQREKAASLAAQIPGAEFVARVPSGMERPFADRSTPQEALVMQFSGKPVNEYAVHARLHDMFRSLDVRIDTLIGSGRTEVLLIKCPSPAQVARESLIYAENASLGLCFLQAPAVLRKSPADFALWSPLPPSLPLMRRLKENLDPGGVLNPGRFLGGL